MTVKTEKYVQIGTTTENQISAGRGWSPILANVVDSERVVQQVVDWTGGSGAKPITGQYIGVSGFVEDIADATDIKGEQGADGAPASLQNIDDRIDVQLDTGGTIKTALDTKEPTITAGTTSQYYRGDKTFQTLDKTAVGLSNVANVDTTTTANISDSTDKRFVTDAQQAKFVAATTSSDGYLTSTDWNTFTRAGTVCTTSPSSPVTMSGLYSRSYSITANTTFDLSGWAADAYTLTIRNDSSVTSYVVTLNGITGETFLLEGGVGGAQGNIGAVTTTVTLRAGETIEVRSVGTNVYRVRSSFQSWNFMGDFKIRSTYTSGLKAISFSHAAGAAFTTDCAITVPNVAAIDLGKISASWAYSAATGILTQTNADTTTLTATILRPVPTKQTTTFTAVANTINRWGVGVTGAKQISLPASPADGDTIEVWDNEEASVYGNSGITTLTVLSTPNYIVVNPVTSLDVLSGQGGVSGLMIRLVYRSATSIWSVQYFYADRFNSLDWYLEDGTNSARSMKYSLSALTALRTITVPDANVNLGKIPTALSYSASTDTLTHTNTDGTTLTATIKAKRSLDYALSDQTTAIATGTPLTCRAPYAFTITSVKASLKTAQASGSLFTLDIKKNGTSIFSTLLTFDNTEKTTATAATAAVLSSTSLADDDELTFIVTQVGDSTAIGLTISIVGYPT